MSQINKSLKKWINISGLNNALLNWSDFWTKEIIGEGATCLVYKAKYIRND